MISADTLGLTDAQFDHARVMISVVAARKLPQRAGVVLIETALVESGLRIFANPNVPASMKIPHEDVGTDHASVGILQQQVPSWGSAVECMDPAKATMKFLDGGGNNPGLLTLPSWRLEMVGYGQASRWDQLPTGAAAQAVQVSAFPDRYQAQEARAVQIVTALWPHLQPEGVMEFRLIKARGKPEVYAYNWAGLWWHIPNSEWLKIVTTLPGCLNARPDDVDQAHFDCTQRMVASAKE